jgi:hypothetical protein
MPVGAQWSRCAVAVPARAVRALGARVETGAEAVAWT